ncbi:MAG: ABC transporter ATP-binding protein, partial [Armatimonadota bacterium]|nr:ABC transporter ATP-binding protein [Armatimonadota bacterium]
RAGRGPRQTVTPELEHRTPPPVLAARGISKSFPGVRALDRVDLEVAEGEVHAVLGQNGAGKTTLMNILFGLIHPDEGEVYLRGRRVRFRSPHDALASGIGMVHQTRRLVPAHTVLENLVLGHPRARGLLDLRRARQELEALCARYGVHVDLGARVWQLSEGEKQWVEILKALYAGVRILILDEPTSALTPPEVQALLRALRALVDQDGVTVVLVTHKLPVVRAVARTVTVLRAGRVAARLSVSDTTDHELVQHMVGQEVTLPTVQAPDHRGPVVLEVEDLSAYNDKGVLSLRGVSLTVHEGEIVGVAGVTGNGQEELAQVLAGLRPAVSGRVRLLGRDVTHLPTLDRWRLGLGYVPAERTEVASVAALSLVENTGLNYHFDPEFCPRGMLDRARLERLTRQILATFRVKAPHPYVRAQHLSGGNLQKLVLGRVLSRQPRLLVAHLPTQGLDVEAASFVRAQLLEAKARGAAVLLISEDLDEIFAVSDRVGALYEGRFVALVPRNEADPETVGAWMAGSLGRRA